MFANAKATPDCKGAADFATSHYTRAHSIIAASRARTAALSLLQKTANDDD
jgi:hypothetical protein